jgi:hypothetical protein
MTPAQDRTRGKCTERAVANKVGGTRLGLLGKEDVDAVQFSIEVKDRKTFAGTSFMEQAIKNCREGKTPLVVVHVTGKRHDGDLIMMRLKDCQDWQGNACRVDKS